MSKNPVLFILKNQHLHLHPDKAVYWDETEMLIVSDLHLGKSGHFRKHGVPVPKSVNNENLYRLQKLIDCFNPKKILFLGDLFHSDMNEEWEDFIQWRLLNSDIEMHLTLGNHDFYPEQEYHKLDLVTSRLFEFPPFRFAHDVDEINSDSDKYLLSGHVHPSVRLTGRGRQTLRVPCFYFKEFFALLPAFGAFTGTHSIKPGVEESVFAIIEKEIIALHDTF